MKLGLRFKLVILLALLSASILPCGALADICGKFTITVNDGKSPAESYAYAGGILTVYAGADVTLSSTGDTHPDRLILGSREGGHTGQTKVTLNGLTTRFSDGNNSAGGSYSTATPNGDSGTTAVELVENADVVLKLAEGSKNDIMSGTGRAGIYVPVTSALEIQGPGTLTVQGGLSGTGIGGDTWSDAGSIIISEGAVIVATSGADGAAIGGGHANDRLQRQKGYVKSIVIKDSVVIAKSTRNGAAIGTGCWYQQLDGREPPEIKIENSIVRAFTQENDYGWPVNAIGIGFNEQVLRDVTVDIKNSVIVAGNGQSGGSYQTLPESTKTVGSSIITDNPADHGDRLSADVVTLTGSFTMPDSEKVELNGKSSLKVNGSLNAPGMYSLTLSGAELEGETEGTYYSDGTYYFQAGKSITLRVAAQIQDSFSDWEIAGLTNFQRNADNTLTFVMPANAATVTAKRISPTIAPTKSPTTAPTVAPTATQTTVPTVTPAAAPPRTGDDSLVPFWTLSVCASLVAAMGLLIGREKARCR